MPLQANVKLISVDDHIIEPPRVWADRLPAKYQEAGPRFIELDDDVTLASVTLDGAARSPEPVRLSKGSQVWMYENEFAPDLTMNAVAGMPRNEWGDWMRSPRRYEMIRPGCTQPLARLADMDLDGVWAQVGFPSWPNFAGTRFIHSTDKALAHACVVAYNDWVIDEWCGAAPSRLIPLVILPLWDRAACVAEVGRTAAKGAKGVSFTEDPRPLGLPAFATREWDPVFAAIEESQLALCVHFGTSGVVPGGTRAARSAVIGTNSMMAAAELAYSHILVEHPNLKVVLAEGGIGWAPWLLQRLDYTWERMRDQYEMPDVRPSELFRRQVYVCGIDDQCGIDMRDRIGIDHIMLESDYPHLDSLWPDTRARAVEMLAGVPDDEAAMIAELNARAVFRHVG